MVVQQILGIGGGEFIALLVLAVVMFGPEKLPELARKAARVLHFLKQIANGATNQLKAELGPEYADLTPADLEPKRLAMRLLELENLQQELAEVKSELELVKTEIDTEIADGDAHLEDITNQLNQSDTEQPDQ